MEVVCSSFACTGVGFFWTISWGFFLSSFFVVFLEERKLGQEL